MLTVARSTRGGKKLQYEGFSYRYQKQIKEGHRWKCDAANKDFKCQGYLVTENDGDSPGIIRAGGHTHSANPFKQQVRDAVREMKEKALAEPTATAHRVVSDAYRNLGGALLSQLPQTPNLKRALRRTREADRKRHHAEGVDGATPCDANLTDLAIPPSYLEVNNQPFLLHDSGPGPGRILAIGTSANMSFLEECPVWVADGTFKVCPSLWAQVYSVHGIKAGYTIPCAYFLLPDKSAATYTKVWETVKQFANPAEPPALLTDFERASFGAAQRVFPGVDSGGCLFHLAQSIDRKIAALGLQGKYNSDGEFKLRVKMLLGCAFLPPEEVVGAFVGMEPLFADDEQEFLGYFESTYIGRPAGAGRRPPLFPIRFWSVFGRHEHGALRTCNAVESFHNAFATGLVRAAHPTIWAFLADLKRQQNLTEKDIVDIEAGRVKTERKKERGRNERIATLVSRYAEHNDAIRLRRGIAYNYLDA